ncbi:hypothetical protein SEUCBS139899_005188 [Sporothrix eucalyptigena]
MFALVDPSSSESKEIEEVDEEALSAAKKKELDIAVRQRLRFLQDPYNISKAVEGMIKKGKFEEALHLTRAACKDKKVEVSWNLLIDYQMRNHRLNNAIKLFNEMKKRGQRPNAQTYTTIFRGCAMSPHATQAVYQATRIYYSMLSNERIKPNTMHMNAVLNVCSRAKDIESLFSIINTADENTRRPDTLTYTIVLNGLRYATVHPAVRLGTKDSDADAVEEVHEDKESAEVSIGRARTVWEEIIKKWRQGVLVVDEELVCAMGRLIRMGSRQDNDDVLSLVQQTMGIQRPDRPTALAVDALLESTGTKKKETERSNEAESQDAEPTAESTVEPATKTETEAVVKETAAEPEPQTTLEAVPVVPAAQSATPPARVSQFDDTNGALVPGKKGKGGRGGMFVKPGSNTLSLVLASISSSGKTSLAWTYWEILTGKPYNIVPDSENWYQLLRTLQRGHASAKTVDAMVKMPREYINEKTFQMAMSACAADNLNDGAFANAGKILDLMSKTLREPDIYTMRLYLQTAMTSNRRFRDTMKKEANNPLAREKAKLAFGAQLVRALRRLWDPLRLAGNATGFNETWGSTSSPTYSPPDKESGELGQEYNAKRELAALARMMVSAADMVVTENMADNDTIKDVRVSRNLLNRQVTRFYEAREEREPRLRKGRQDNKGKRDGRGRSYDSQVNSRHERDADREERAGGW